MAEDTVTLEGLRAEWRDKFMTAPPKLRSRDLMAREIAYYLQHIGQVQSIDDLLNDDRLYRFAMTAFGLTPGIALAAAFGYRITSTWIPVLAGWLFYNHLQRHDDI